MNSAIGCISELLLTSVATTNATAMAGGTYYVDAASTCGAACAGGLNDPFPEIQAAIDAPWVVDGDVVRVSPGTYYGVDFKGKALEVVSTQGPSMTFITPASSPSSAVYFVSGEGESSILDGFTISGGKGDWTPPNFRGGGVFCSGSSPTLISCQIVGNVLDGGVLSGGNTYGAGLYCEAGTPRLIGCTIANNVARAVVDEGHAGGGGVHGPARLVDCSVEANKVIGYKNGNLPTYGGGVAFATVFSSRIAGNTVEAFGFSVSVNPDARGAGGGAYAAVLVDCEVTENELLVYGHSSDAYGGSPPLGYGAGGGAWGSQITSSVIAGNRLMTQPTWSTFLPDLTGGGIAESTVSSSIISNNLVGPVTASSGSSVGGGASGGELTNCTLWGNSAFNEGGGVNGSVVCSAIVWGNVPDSMSPVATPNVTYSTVEGGHPNPTNISDDPLLWDPLTGDFHLRPGSPCIGASGPCALIPDIGAVAFDPVYCSDPIVYCTAKQTSAGCTPAISAVGTPSLSDGAQLRVGADNLANQVIGILFYGKDGPTALPFLGGWMCAKSPIVRTPPMFSGGATGGNDCSGSYLFNFEDWVLGGQDPDLVPGASTSCQFWFRDPPATFSSGLTDAVRFILCN